MEDPNFMSPMEDPNYISAMKEEMLIEYSVVEVKGFVQRLIFDIHCRNKDETGQMYKELKEIPNLPPVEDVSESIGSNHIFHYLYSEIWYRQLSCPTLQERIACWENYSYLFKSLRCGVEIWLPIEWLWDLLDQFVNRFQSFCEFRDKETLTKEDKEHEEPWSPFATLSLLRSIVQESSIGQFLKDPMEVMYPNEYDVSKSLGYYAMVGLLRVHCLLGQYQTGLKRLYPIDICKRGYYTWVLGCQISTVYHCAFANFMLGKYDEAVCGLNRFLSYLYCSEHYLKTSPGYEQMQDMISQMYALLAVCHQVCSQDDLIDAIVIHQLSKRFGPDIRRLQKLFDGKSFRLLLQRAWPIFSAPFEPHIADPRDFHSKSARYLHNPDEKTAEQLYPQECLPFDPDDREPYISHNQLDALIERLIATARMSKLKLK